MVYNNNQFLFKQLLDDVVVELKKEFLSMDTTDAPLYPAGSYVNIDVYKKWKMIVVKIMGEWDRDNKEKYPIFAKLIESFGDTCRGGGYSILELGGMVLPHTDTEEGHELYVIVHVPLVIPYGDVGFTVDSVSGKWEEGNAFILDVEKVHSIWNNTEERRVVILLELLKETQI